MSTYVRKYHSTRAYADGTLLIQQSPFRSVKINWALNLTLNYWSCLPQDIAHTKHQRYDLLTRRGYWITRGGTEGAIYQLCTYLSVMRCHYNGKIVVIMTMHGAEECKAGKWHAQAISCPRNPSPRRIAKMPRMTTASNAKVTSALASVWMREQ
jgi:hypothetical protein